VGREVERDLSSGATREFHLPRSAFFAPPPVVIALEFRYISVITSNTERLSE